MANYNLQKDIEKAIIKYPSLVLLNESKVITLEGKIPLKKPNGEIITEYFIRIQYPQRFPYCFPIVFELEEKIPKEVDRHVNQKDGSICFAVRPAERLRCLNGITTSDFLEKIAIPHFAAQYLFGNGYKDILNSGYRHFNDGIKQYYLELFSTDSWCEVKEGFERTIRNRLPKRNNICYCGKKKKYKSCHYKPIETLKRLGIPYLIDELELLKD